MSEPTQDDAVRILVCLPSMAEGVRLPLIATLAGNALGRSLTIATPDEIAAPEQAMQAHIISYTPLSPATHSWVLTAADYRNASQLLQQHNGTHALLLGTEAATLSEQCIARLLDAATSTNASVIFPNYAFSAQQALVNAAILHPLTQALYGTRVHFPLPFDIAFNAAAADRFASAATRLLQRDANCLLWPAAEAAAAGLIMSEVTCGTRNTPPPPSDDLTDLLSLVVGSLFADAEVKAAVWQRSRTFTAVPSAVSSRSTTAQNPAAEEEVHSLVDGFRNAYINLHDLWSLVLPPQSLLALKRLSQSSAENFMMADTLWVRIVYDFLLAYRLRTLSQTHLLGALTPLYLAWVASHLRIAGDDGPRSQLHIESLAAAFQSDKPYLLGRWRWPDRFNP